MTQARDEFEQFGTSIKALEIPKIDFPIKGGGGLGKASIPTS